MRTTDKQKSLFSKRFIELRKSRGLTQAELAEQLGIGRDQVAYYEAKAKNPTAETLNNFASFFNVSPDFFLLDDDELNSKPGPESLLDQKIKQLKALPRAQQKTVIAMLDGLLSSITTSK